MKQLFLSSRGGSALASLGLARYKSRAPLTRRLPPCRPRTTDASERRPYQLAARNRPLRGFATRGEMRLRRSRQVGRGRRPSREAAARARANTPSEASAELRGVKKLFYKLFLLFPSTCSTRLNRECYFLTQRHRGTEIFLGTGPAIANKIKGSKGPSPSFTAHPTILYLPGALVDALSIAESS